MSTIQVRYSKHFDVNIIDGQFDIALDYYIEWCEDNNQEPEVPQNSELMDITQEQFEHVLYHAEIQGMEINP